MMFFIGTLKPLTLYFVLCRRSSLERVGFNFFHKADTRGQGGYPLERIPQEFQGEGYPFFLLGVLKIM